MPSNDFDPIRAEFTLPDNFPVEVLAEADAVDTSPTPENREDATALPFVTIDPPGSKDLDQAVYLESTNDGFRLHYAIADLAAFIQPGGRIDREAKKRGLTLYLPDENVPLHPTALSENAASLLPNQTRPAVLWTIDTDHSGEPTSVNVRRALVRSVAQYDYDTVQNAFDTGQPPTAVAPLAELGPLRRECRIRRGAIELQLPEQTISADISGEWVLDRRPRNDVEVWNAELSILTGMAAAEIMLEAKIGILRTVPTPEQGAKRWLRRSARALGITWPSNTDLAHVLGTLDPTQPESLAFYADATRLLRGAGYSLIDGSDTSQLNHAGIGGPYTHVTAPIRRLVDRYAAEICVALSAKNPVPSWVSDALPELSTTMRTADSLASQVDRACLDQVEAWMLADRVGDVFDAVVLRAEANKAEILLDEPPVMAKCKGNSLPEGEKIKVRLTTVDTDERKVSFDRVE